MTDDDALIDLLNGFEGSKFSTFDTEVFLDEEGMPTDRFLQALKSDMRVLPNQDNATTYTESTSRQINREFSSQHHPAQKYSSGFDDDYLADFVFSDEEQDYRRNTPATYSRDYQKREPTHSKGKMAAANASLTLNKSRSADVEHTTSGTKVSRKVKFNGDPSTYSKVNDVFVSSAAFASTVKSEMKLKKKKAAPFVKVLKNTADQSRSPSYTNPTESSRIHSHISAALGTTSNNISSHSITTEEVHFPRAVGLDTTEIEVEAESRVKSLQLRLQGQLQTIRSLEGQLGDALQLVEARNKQLAHCNARLKAAASTPHAQQHGTNGTLTTSTLGAAGNVNLKSDAAAAKAAELAEQYKVQVDFLQAKLNEESGKRQRADERCRVLKNYSEKSKERCLQLESQNAELKGALAEVSAKMEKFRKNYKDQASESAAQKNEVTAREEENSKLKRQLEKTESALRNLQMTLEHSREELRAQKVETSALQSKCKQLVLQQEIQHEREASRRAEDRLKGLEHRDKERDRDHYSHHQQHSNNSNTATTSTPSHTSSTSHAHHRKGAGGNHTNTISNNNTNASHNSHNSHSSASYRSRSGSVEDYEALNTQQHLHYLNQLAREGMVINPTKMNTKTRPHSGQNNMQHIVHLPPTPDSHYVYTHLPPQSNMNLSQQSALLHSTSHPTSTSQHSTSRSYDESIRSFIDHDEQRLDRDVVMQTHLALQQEPKHVIINEDEHSRPPPWRPASGSGSASNNNNSTNNANNQAASTRNSIVNTALRNSFSDFTPPSAMEAYHTTTNPTNTNTSSANAHRVNSTHGSMSDSELEPSTRRSPAASSSAVSFIRQKVINSGFSPVTLHTRAGSAEKIRSAGNTNDYSAVKIGVAERSHASGSVASGYNSSIVSHDTRSRADSNISLQSGASSKGPTNRLQALYERVTNKTT